LPGKQTVLLRFIHPATRIVGILWAWAVLCSALLGICSGSCGQYR